ncbi:hypothetical protein N0V82_001713 [Gnomoniopsis sp. IMI 355080]|nr:hypothetical protein N0V82_001713 [Gnomoniopsis sp. IMI 355080]
MFYNIDYNSLKHFIKVHTTKDEAKAIAIPGQPDTHLAKVEDELFHELCAQHAGAGLFVTAKADEINRRLQSLSDEIHRLIVRCANTNPDSIPRKRQRKFTRLEREVLQCGDDIQHLERFVNAQAIAFRKILKKYRPKSFVRKDFQPLRDAYQDLLHTVRSSTPARSLPQSPVQQSEETPVGSYRDGAQPPSRRVTIETAPPQTYSPQFSREETAGYWNEYDNGSENGEMEERYVIYANPDEAGSPDFRAMLHAFAKPFATARSWVKARKPERQPLLISRHASDSSYGATTTTTTTEGAPSSPTTSTGCFSSLGRPPPSRGNDSSTAVETDAEEEDDEADLLMEAGYASSEEFPSAGYEAHYAALPSVNDQRMHMYKDRVMFLATSGLFAMSFLLLGIAAVLILTGRHKMRVEVDAGATVGAVVSLACACTALALTMARWESLSGVNRAVVSVTFSTACVLNGMLLVLVMGNTAL